MTQKFKKLLKNNALDLERIVGQERLRASGITIDYASFGMSEPVINKDLKKMMSKKLIKSLAGTSSKQIAGYSSSQRIGAHNP